jgi:hypothetical protein
MNTDNIDIKLIMGRSELREIRKFENGRMVFYSYRIDYDQNGVETGRTEPEAISSIGWDDGSPFTEIDYESLRK